MNKTSNLRTTYYALRTTPGFTLIELVVVVGIITVVTSIVLANNAKYGGSVLLQNLAYDIALSIRQAQVYGISVRGFGVNNSTFTVGYGMHFSTTDPTHYELFADLAGTGVYDANFNPPENIPPSPYVIGRGYKIKSLCATRNNNEQCNFDTLDVLFKRPEPDARITARNGSGQSCVENNNQCQESARIIIESPRGDVLSVVVDATGQISVQ